MRLFAKVSLLIITIATASASLAGQNSQADVYAERAQDLVQAGDLKRAESELRLALKLEPSNPASLASMGGILAMEHKLPESSVYFKKALRLDPTNLRVCLNLIVNLWQMGRLQEARHNFELALKIKPRDPSAVLLLGTLAENLKEYRTTIHLLGAVPELTKQKPEAMAALASAYYHTGKRDKARQTLNDLAKSYQEPQAIFLGGQIADEGGDYETAEKLFLSIRGSYPDAAVLTFNLALIAYRAGRINDCQESLENLIASGYKHGNVYNLLGWCYEKQKELRQSVGAFEQAISLNPSNESYYIDLMTILLRNGHMPEALQVGKRGVAALPNSSQIYDMKGLAELKLGFLTSAINSYTRATKLDPSDAAADVGRAVAESSDGMTKRAQADFEIGIKRFPRDANHFVEYALFLLKQAQMGDRTARIRAIELLKTAIRLDKSLSEPYYQLGKIDLERGRVTEALAELQTAAKLSPGESKIHFALARAYRRLGRRQEARKELKIYQQLRNRRNPALAPAGMPGQS